MDRYQVGFDSQLGIVVVMVSGEITQPLGEEIITQARQLAAQHRAGILYDVRQATVSVPFSRWFYLPRELDVLTSQNTRNAKAAIVAPADQLQEYRFYETVATNIGLSVKIFLDADEAAGWLTAGGEP